MSQFEDHQNLSEGEQSVARAKKSKKLDMEVTMDRRTLKDRRKKNERRKEGVKVDAERRTSQRRTVTRRRQIDPTTCERDYTQDEIEFMQAMDAYKRKSGRMFPTCSEILEVVRDLGYERKNAPQPVANAGEMADAETAEADDREADSITGAESELVAEEA